MSAAIFIVALFVALVLTNMWWAVEYRWLKRETERNTDRIDKAWDKLYALEPEMRGGFREMGLKWVPPKRAEDGKWVSE